MQTLVLKTGWQFLGTDAQNAPKPEQLNKPSSGDKQWMPITVPGDINAALIEQGQMPSPHFDVAAKECFWVTSRDWWYQLEFDAQDLASVPSKVCFECADGTADVWLNDHYLGVMKNAFRPHEFSLKDALKPKKNRFLIRFHAIDSLLGSRVMDQKAACAAPAWGYRRAFLRKPQYNFGWDWALPLPSLGLGGPVRIEPAIAPQITHFSLKPFLSGRVDLDFEVNKFAKESGYEIQIEISGHGQKIQKQLNRGTFKSYLSLQIPNPQLWYPRGFGEQPLYDYVVQLIVGGKAVETRKGRFGIRESRIEEKPFTEDAGPGFSFGLIINNESIFCKGTNWCPLELWPAMATREQCEYYLQKIVESNFNMVRIWGGGIYEPDYFYELCDELGLMVWQDFMFAGAGIPLDLLREEILAESKYQIQRLRIHPSIVLWCGCNEDVYSWQHPLAKSDSLQTDDIKTSHDAQWSVDRLKWDPELYYILLRGAVNLLGQGVPYVESSPQSRDDSGNLPNSGNCHISSWKFSLFETKGEHQEWRRHFEKVCSFDSEFCIQGPADQSTIERFMAPENHWPPNDAWIFHVQKGHGSIPHHEQTLRIAGATFGKINNLEQYVKHGQATHVEMMRAEFETARRDRPNSGGTMFWMFNDCWPTSNWSVIDYYRTPKPSFFAAKRACAPLLPIIFERNQVFGFYMSNDTNSSHEATLHYGQQNFSGKIAWEKKVKMALERNHCISFARFDRSALTLGREDYLFIYARVDGKVLDPVIYFPNAWRDVNWPKTEVEVTEIEQSQRGASHLTRLVITGSAFTRFCFIKYPEMGDCIFSDNYFDLPIHTSKTVLIESRHKLDISKLRLGHWLTHWSGEPISSPHPEKDKSLQEPVLAK